jgi:hypothetical protein
MHAFEIYIEETKPKELGHANVTITGATSIHVNDIPPQFLKELEEKFGKPASAPAATGMI